MAAARRSGLAAVVGAGLTAATQAAPGYGLPWFVFYALRGGAAPAPALRLAAVAGVAAAAGAVATFGGAGRPRRERLPLALIGALAGLAVAVVACESGVVPTTAYLLTYLQGIVAGSYRGATGSTGARHRDEEVAGGTGGDLPAPRRADRDQRRGRRW